jgi:hypothetical protein
MAQQDIRYDLNGLLLLDRERRGRMRRWPPTATGWPLPRAWPRTAPRRIPPGSHHPAAQDRCSELSNACSSDGDEPVTACEIGAHAGASPASATCRHRQSKVVARQFPDYNRVIPAGAAERRLEVAREDPARLPCSRAAILLREVAQGCVCVGGADGRLAVSCSNTDQEEAAGGGSRSTTSGDVASTSASTSPYLLDVPRRTSVSDDRHPRPRAMPELELRL